MPDLERVQQNTPLTLSHTFTEGGVPVEPGTVTIGITAADGSVVVAPGTAVTAGGTGVRTFNLTTAHMALLDILRVTWTSTLKGTLQSYVEVVGGFLCSLGDIGAEFPDADVAERARVRMAAEQRLESECGQAFVPRYAYERNRRVRNGRARLGWPNIRAIRSVDVDGYEYGSAVDVLTFGGSEMLAVGSGSYATVGYEHGQDYADERVRSAVVLAAREMFSTSAGGYVVRREADGQAVTYASPSSNGGGFLDPGLRALVRDLQGALVR
jgi:hypothetical protein